jgi:integrase
MRAPRKYVAKDGTESWRVRYRTTSDTEKSETFYDEASAVEFSGLLKALGYVRALAYLDDRAKTEGDDRRTKAITVGDLFAKWFEWKSAVDKKGQLVRVRSGRTLDDYEKMYRRHIGPAFGEMPANLVSQIDVQDWLDKLPVAAKTAADYHSLLHGLFTWGIHPTRAMVINDPCIDTQLPMRRKKQPKGLRPAEWQVLHAAALKVDQHAADLLLFMASTGWRWSECVAVQAMGVDHWIDDNGISHTFVTMGRVLRRENGAHVFVEDAKSEAGSRRVRLVGPGEQMVLDRIHGKRPTELVLTNKRGNRWTYSSFHTRVWERPSGNDKHGKPRKDPAPRKPRILEEARKLGLDRPDLTLHWLRHTHVGMLILAGEPLTAIQRRLGHASIKTTSDTYGRMIEDASDAGLERVAAMLGGVKPRLQPEALVSAATPALARAGD